MGRVSGTQRQTSFRMSGLMYDRLVAISARLNIPMSEVIVRLIIAGLDTTQDLALDQPSHGGFARYERHAVE